MSKAKAEVINNNRKLGLLIAFQLNLVKELGNLLKGLGFNRIYIKKSRFT